MLIFRLPISVLMCNWTNCGRSPQVRGYVDQGISGSKQRRPELDQLMIDAHDRYGYYWIGNNLTLQAVDADTIDPCMHLAWRVLAGLLLVSAVLPWIGRLSPARQMFCWMSASGAGDRALGLSTLGVLLVVAAGTLAGAGRSTWRQRASLLGVTVLGALAIALVVTAMPARSEARRRFQLAAASLSHR